MKIDNYITTREQYDICVECPAEGIVLDHNGNIKNVRIRSSSKFTIE